METLFNAKRIHIRPLVLADAEFIYQLLNSPGWLQYIGDRHIKTIVEAKSYIRTILETPKLLYHVIIKTNSLNPIGILSFIKRDNFDYPDFGFALLPDFQKKGYALEASVVFLKTLFKEHPSIKVIAICKKENETSIKLLSKIGFQYSYETTNNGEQLHVYKLTNDALIYKYR